MDNQLAKKNYAIVYILGIIAFLVSFIPFSFILSAVLTWFFSKITILLLLFVVYKNSKKGGIAPQTQAIIVIYFIYTIVYPVLVLSYLLSWLPWYFDRIRLLLEIMIIILAVRTARYSSPGNQITSLNQIPQPPNSNSIPNRTSKQGVIMWLQIILSLLFAGAGFLLSVMFLTLSHDGGLIFYLLFPFVGGTIAVLGIVKRKWWGTLFLAALFVNLVFVLRS